MTDRPFDVDAARALLSVDESWRDKKWSARQWTAAVVTFRDLLGEAIREIEATRTELVQARAERDAANAQCAKAVSEREEQAARWDRQDCERSDAIGGLECRVLELRDERDRARNTAAALEAENAVLLDGLRRLRKTACDGCDAAEVAHNVLASVDPLRDEPEAADRG